MRGVAALLVVLYHFVDTLAGPLRSGVTSPLVWVSSHGNLGVDIFFVLSGFVIAHSVVGGRYTWKYFGRYASRRIVRLDPPLWVTIALELLLVRAGLALYPELASHMPTGREVLSNMTYTQRFLGYGEVVPVFWSLTYEVQFYIITVLACVAAAKVEGRSAIARSARMVPLLNVAFGVAFIYSVLIWVGVFPLPVRGLFVDRWFQFALGITAWMVVQRRTPLRRWAFLATLAVLAGLLIAPNAYRCQTTCVAALTSGALVWVGMRGEMHAHLSGRTLQFLGKVSYSLYLIHLVIGARFLKVAMRVTGPDIGTATALVLLAASVTVSVFAAWVLNVAVERPSMTFARRIRLPKRDRATVPASTPTAVKPTP